MSAYGRKQPVRQPRVEKVLEMLNAELAMVMGQVGAPAISDIGPQHIGRQ